MSCSYPWVFSNLSHIYNYIIHLSFIGEYINGDRALRSVFRRLSMQSRNVSCPEVERVLLSEGCRVSDKGLELLSRRCPELTHLQIQMSFNITNNALYNLVTKCTNLQHLDVTGECFFLH